MYKLDPNLGWNSGAKSRVAWDGNCQATFRVPESVSGVVCGLSGSDTSTDYREIKHGLYFAKVGGVPFVYVYESGVQRGSPVTYEETDVFTVRRVDGVVTYWKQSTLLYTSLVPSSGPLYVDSSLYAAGDKII